jgi:6-phosphogluconolactonase (cycloisomerase 2 family)
MRVLTLGLALAVLAARPAGAGRMLYATAASLDRIDGFCLRDNGALAPAPAVSIGTGSTQPRRLVVANDVLYVVEVDRVEAFRIGARGGLSRIGRTPTRPRSGPRDIAITTGRTMLYVPDRSRSRIIGHPLDTEGRPAEDFTTCIQGRLGASYQNLAVNADKLYVSSSGGNGRIEVFGIAADGSLVGADGAPTVQDCVGATPGAERPPATPPLSERRRIGDVKSFVVVGGLLYAEDRARHRIRAFRLEADGNFPPPTIENPDKPNRLTWPKAESKTKRVAQYQQILHYGSALIATQFFRGRIDSYELTLDGQLPKRPKRESKADLRHTPVRLTTDQGVVYVASGEFDRIIAYRLRANGVLAAREPFSQTNEQQGSFPNDVAVAMLAAGCGF